MDPKKDRCPNCEEVAMQPWSGKETGRACPACHHIEERASESLFGNLTKPVSPYDEGGK